MFATFAAIAEFEDRLIARPFSVRSVQLEVVVILVRISLLGVRSGGGGVGGAS